MKAERRHDLKTNTLATTIIELPNFWKQHGTKVLIALVAIVAIALLVQHRVKSRREAQAKALEGLAAAQEHISMLRNPRLMQMPPAESMSRVKTEAELASAALADVLNLASDSKVRAEALVARGDLNLVLAHLPNVPGATTRPALAKPLPEDDYRQRAAEAYQEVLDKHLEHRTSAVTAHFGLAAIDEDKGNWTGAAAHYQKVRDDTSVPEVIRKLAEARVGELSVLQQTPLLGSTTQPVAVAAPTTAPTTAPSTQPAM